MKYHSHNLELQRKNSGADPKRVRYYASLTDSEALKQGKEYSALPERWTIFITENDLYDGGYPIYHIDQMIRELKTPFIDGSHTLYVNGSFKDRSTPIGAFIADLVCTDPEKIVNPVLKQGMLELKATPEGKEEMTEAVWKYFEPIIERNRKEGREEGIETQTKSVVLNAFAKGLPLDLIASLNEISVEKVLAILAKENLLV